MGTNITGIGNANAIGFKSRVTGGIYFPPELKDALVGVWSAYGKSNDSTDRNIIKNKIKDRGGDFVISNAAFKLNSGFGGFVEDFTSWDRIDSSTVEISNDGSKIKCINTTLNVQYLFNSINRDIPSFKVKISNFTKGNITYYYRKEDGIEAFLRIEPSPLDKVLELPKSYNTVENGTGGRGGFYSSNINIGVTITQIPSFEGAFVTDGIDDLITSTKTVQEMGITDEITVVSMIHKISSDNNWTNLIGELKGDHTFVANRGINTDKTGIYGYTYNYNENAIVINNILGDKNDYIVKTSTSLGLDNKYYVTGFRSAGIIQNISQIAWYWTFIANRVLTTDEINQVIAYFNLDRTLNPDILCDVKKQGITNENHAEFGDKLIDFSGNGRDIQLNNIAWKGDSGIGKYVEDFTTWYGSTGVLQTFSKIEVTDGFKHNWVITRRSGESAINSFKVLIKGIPENGYIQYRYFESEDATKKSSIDIYEDGEYSLPNSTLNNLNDLVGFQLFAKIPPLDSQSFIGLTITQIPSHAGALCLDGVEDYGKVTGLPIYKDYTVVADREVFNAIGCVLSNDNPGAFIFEINSASVYSFGEVTTSLTTPTDKQIRYQTKYSYNGQNISIGAAKEGTSNMWLGTIRDNDARFRSAAIYSLMTFPYSMSEFLIERQLKKHKLGTLYPDMVEFRPIVTYDKDLISKLKYFYIPKYANWVSISPGDYLPNNAEISFTVDLRYPVDKVSSNLVFSNLENVRVVKSSGSGNSFDIRAYVTNKSPQKINITIDEYIRYEDIVQPYPVLLRFKDENGNEVSWGGKFKVGSNITRIGSIADPESNLLNGLYSISGLSLNGKAVTSSTSIVEKQMVFRTTATWLLDNNEPKCILSPRLLRIPNSSYKILGHIPDISGHGNNGVIHNSAYAEGSGVNEDGSYQFDGIDDFVTIPTLSSGGKQVLMKVNSRKSDCYLYDQRNNWTQYLGIVSTKDFIAYNYSNQRGKTYIDGILNENITANDLIGITHNITVTNNRDDVKQYSPCIGTSFARNSYAQMALYDFMLFDDISTDDKIKQLNEYVGIEAKVELPPYYWDAYGKTNLDADKATIQQRGVAVGDYDLTNTNFAYDKMSGFGGYTLGKFTNSWSLSNNNNSISIVARNPYDITLKKLGGNSDWEFNTTELKIISNPVSVKFKSDKNIRFTCDYHYYTVGGNSEGAPLGITSKDLIANEDTIITISPISQENIDKYNIDINRGYYLIYFQLSPTLAVNEEVTIEMLPLYPNGLVYDGITDYSENANIPALTDFTVIAKRVWMNKDNPMNECFIHKGVVSTPISESALMLEYEIGNDTYYRSSSYGGYINIKRSNRPEIITYQTTESYNGISIIKGSGIDTQGLVVGAVTNNYWKGVFYKLILYPKTIPLLQINFLKNLMERDEIIDLNNPIFIKNE